MPETAGRSTAGAQTLARGLAALREVAASEGGLTVQELAERLDVHRTIAYRMIATLVEAALVSRGEDGRYRGAVGLLELRAAGYEAFKHAAEPVLRDLANELGATASLLVPEQDEAIALLVVSPQAARYHIAFSAGSRHPLDRGAAGHALRAALPQVGPEPDVVSTARAVGYAMTFGEVEPGAWGIAAPVHWGAGERIACVNVITYREDVARDSIESVLACARRIEAAVAVQH
ncbi:IclR family transcriptional regulator [Microbacterium sediminicola]